MSMTTSLLHGVQRAASGTHALSGTPFDPATPFHPPRGRYSTVHYGLMFPDLPAPLNFLDFITVIGQPKIGIWRNDHLIETSAADTACLLAGAGVQFPHQFRGYRVSRQLELAEDGSALRFGDEFRFEGSYPNYAVTYRNPEFTVDLEVRATDKVAHFAKLRGGLYDHWSLLCDYTGTVAHQGTRYELAGLSTLEYARAVAVDLRFAFFTYQIINLDADTQVLMVELLGPLGVPVQRAVYLRSRHDHGGVFEDGFRFDVTRLEPSARRTPNGREMRLGTEFSWAVDDNDGNELIHIDAVVNDDYVYGMAGGYVGSYRYTGSFRGRPITGTGYVEYVGTR
ncbi:DUF6670 family protein [Nocardia mangyaensis]|nr:DUF6670 family protein [Nocardia mangyaensis]